MNSIFALKIANVLQEVKREAADIHRVHFGVQISYMPQSLCNFSGEPCQLYSNISNCCWPWCWWCDLVEGNSRIRTELGEDKSACSFKYMYLMRNPLSLMESIVAALNSVQPKILKSFQFKSLLFPLLCFPPYRETKNKFGVHGLQICNYQYLLSVN